MIELRLYLESDQSAIDTLIQSIASEFEFTISNPNKSILPVLDEYWVVLFNKKLVGTAGVIKIDEECAMLKNMFVQKEFRGAAFGISKTLLDRVLEWCFLEKTTTVYLGTMSQFKAAQKFYEKYDFEKISAFDLPSSFVSNPVDDVFYKKKLR